MQTITTIGLDIAKSALAGGEFIDENGGGAGGRVRGCANVSVKSSPSSCVLSSAVVGASKHPRGASLSQAIRTVARMANAGSA